MSLRDEDDMDLVNDASLPVDIFGVEDESDDDGGGKQHHHAAAALTRVMLNGGSGSGSGSGSGAVGDSGGGGGGGKLISSTLDHHHHHHHLNASPPIMEEDSEDDENMDAESTSTAGGGGGHAPHDSDLLDNDNDILSTLEATQNDALDPLLHHHHHHRVRKQSRRPRYTPEERRSRLEEAVRTVLQEKMSMRQAAMRFDLAKSSLCDYVKKRGIKLPAFRMKSTTNNFGSAGAGGCNKSHLTSMLDKSSEEVDTTVTTISSSSIHTNTIMTSSSLCSTSSNLLSHRKKALQMKTNSNTSAAAAAATATAAAVAGNNNNDLSQNAAPFTTLAPKPSQSAGKQSIVQGHMDAAMRLANLSSSSSTVNTPLPTLIAPRTSLTSSSCNNHHQSNNHTNINNNNNSSSSHHHSGTSDVKLWNTSSNYGNAINNNSSSGKSLLGIATPSFTTQKSDLKVVSYKTTALKQITPNAKKQGQEHALSNGSYLKAFMTSGHNAVLDATSSSSTVAMEEDGDDAEDDEEVMIMTGGSGSKSTDHHQKPMLNGTHHHRRESKPTSALSFRSQADDSTEFLSIPSTEEAVKCIIHHLDHKGFSQLTIENWRVQPDSCVYFSPDNGSVFAACIGGKYAGTTSWTISTASLAAPKLKLRCIGEYHNNADDIQNDMIVAIPTHGSLSQWKHWTNVELGIAGKVVYRCHGNIVCRAIHSSKPMFYLKTKDDSSLTTSSNVTTTINGGTDDFNDFFFVQFIHSPNQCSANLDVKPNLSEKQNGYNNHNGGSTTTTTTTTATTMTNNNGTNLRKDAFFYILAELVNVTPDDILSYDLTCCQKASVNSPNVIASSFLTARLGAFAAFHGFLQCIDNFDVSDDVGLHLLYLHDVPVEASSSADPRCRRIAIELEKFMDRLSRCVQFSMPNLLLQLSPFSAYHTRHSFLLQSRLCDADWLHCRLDKKTTSDKTEVNRPTLVVVGSTFSDVMDTTLMKEMASMANVRFQTVENIFDNNFDTKMVLYDNSNRGVEDALYSQLHVSMANIGCAVNQSSSPIQSVCAQSLQDLIHFHATFHQEYCGFHARCMLK